MIEPFFFNNDQLFGCYFPSSDPDSHQGVVICPPLFDDYRRSYRALSDLANACAGHGYHALRFDYFGTGDSGGDLNDVSVGRWCEDIEAAIDELIALTGNIEIVLVGVRIGATLASNCRHPAIKKSVFWDPIESGSDYLDWLGRSDSQFKQEHIEAARFLGRKFEDTVYENFHLGDELTSGLRELEFVRDAGPSMPTHIITSQLTVLKENRYRNCEYAGVEYDWPYYHDGILAPKPVLELLAKRVLAS